MSRALAATLLAGAAGCALLYPTDARAQSAGTTELPLPNVLLLVDTSGSMERMTDDSLPGDKPGTACSPGVSSQPNRWGTLLQALTGTFQPYYSCEALDRSSARFSDEYKIAGHPPYDKNYDLKHHRPLTGSDPATACVNMPYALAGGGGVGGGGYTLPGPPNGFDLKAVQSINNQYVQGVNGGPLGASPPLCNFSQANDGQLDAVQDFVRFGLMTFDSDTSAATGVTSAPYSGTFGTSVDGSGGIPATTPPYARPFDGLWSYLRNAPVAGARQGKPIGCPTLSPFEVGARHWAAPVWEGRHVPFANPVGTLLDIEGTNDQVQRVLLASRPWGATPIAGQLDDARDYLWFNDYGPYGTQTGYKDPYVQKGCRDQYIILLTDGSPNLDLRPNCSGTDCPYAPSYTIAQELYESKLDTTVVSRKSVKTFVIGFSVNGSLRTPNDGFPTTGIVTAGPLSCAKWYADTGANGGNSNVNTMDSVCTTLGASIPKGSTAQACCELNKIALYGSGGPTDPNRIGAFFADSGVDIVTAFSRILGSIAKTATSRTAPGASPSMSLNASGSSQTASATFVASFIPNARKVWSGEIDRTRLFCAANSSTPTQQGPDVNAGDLYSVDTAVQAINGNRRFFTVVGDTTGSNITTTYPATGASSAQPVIDSYATMRPFANVGSGYTADGVQVYRGTEQFGLGATFLALPDFKSALGIDNTTCKKSSYIVTSPPPAQAKTVPPLDNTNCTEVIWDFVTANSASLNKTVGTNTFDFNLRCKNIGGLAAATTGTCSISGAACSLDAPTCPRTGEACVPYCSALGAIFHSTPAIAGPPSGFLRDEGFRGFQAARANRRPIMYVASTDGLLHAFKALYDDPTNLTPGGQNYELWSFIPPAVLPRLATNYPGGQQILLDGAPVVKDTVWYRTGNSLQGTSNLDDWHTTLVASLGAGGGGYYALNVSDPDCGGMPTSTIPGSANACNTAFAAANPGSNAANMLSASAGGTSTGGRQPGPHFLWQITDIEKGASDPAKATRSNVPYSGTPKDFVALFGKQTGTPAITTLTMLDSAGKPVQVGVAILPGGIDGPPVAGGSCPRVIGSFGAGFRVDNIDGSAPAPASPNARQWAQDCAKPVPGRGVTIVRLDNGQIIRHFGRKNQDVPVRIKNYTIDSPFDSPVTGTPVVYPATLGTAAQKIFVGDADGTVWRIDVSEPCNIDPAVGSCSWKAALFADVTAQTGASVSFKQPIAVAPIVSQSPTGTIVVNVATGDQENIVASTDVNYVMSLEETRAQYGPSRLLWYKALTGGERVTGPMAVFDRTLYFATYLPASTADVCANTASAYLWGLDYYKQHIVGTASSGGEYKWCPSGSVNTISGLCTGPTADKEPAGAALVPGVAVTPSLACTSTGALTQDVGNGITSMTPTSYEIKFNFSKAGTSPTGSNAAIAGRGGIRTSTPRYNATLDAWALVTD